MRTSRLFTVAVIVGVMGVSAANASATGKVGIRANGAPLANGSPLLWTSTNFKIVFKALGKVTTDSCENTTVAGTLTKNRAVTDLGTISESVFEGCDTTGTFSGGFAFRDSGKAELKGVVLHYSDCELKKAAMQGTFPFNSAEPGEPLVVTMPAQKFRVEANSGKQCGTSGTMTATFTITSAGEPTLALVE
jgi:hypothetical protein